MLINNFQYICVEKLNVSGMLKNHKLVKSIQDLSFLSLIKENITAGDAGIWNLVPKGDGCSEESNLLGFGRFKVASFFVVNVLFLILSFLIDIKKIIN